MPVTKQNPRIATGKATDPAIDSDAFAALTAYVLETTARGLWINTGGDVYVDFVGGIEGRAAGTNRKFTVLAGSLLPLEITKIYDTSTATGQVLY